MHDLKFDCRLARKLGLDSPNDLLGPDLLNITLNMLQFHGGFE